MHRRIMANIMLIRLNHQWEDRQWEDLHKGTTRAALMDRPLDIIMYVEFPH